MFFFLIKYDKNNLRETFIRMSRFLFTDKNQLKNQKIQVFMINSTKYFKNYNMSSKC